MTATRTPATVDPATAMNRPLVICLLGDFRVLKVGREVPVRGAGKTAMLLTLLALRDRHRVSPPRPRPAS